MLVGDAIEKGEKLEIFGVRSDFTCMGVTL